MTRISGIDLPNDKRIEAALPYIYGIGPTLTKQILAVCQIDPNTRTKNLKEEEIAKLQKEIDSLAEKLGLRDYILRVPWLNQSELKELLSVSDVFLYPSLPFKGWEEQFGYSMAEASLMELPVISTRSGSIEDIVKDNHTGILIKPDNADELKNAMIKLGNDGKLRSLLGREGRRYIVKNFSHEVVAQKFWQFFHSFEK